MRTSSRLCAGLFLFTMLAAFGFSQSTGSLPRLIRITSSTQDETLRRTGTAQAVYSFYASQDAAASMWSESQSVHIDAAGHFTVLLGANSREGVPAGMFGDGEVRWIGISLDGIEQPRIQLVSVPYALKSREADTLNGLSAADILAQAAGLSNPSAASTGNDLQRSAARDTALLIRNSSGALITSSAAASGATNFTASTTDQVVTVTQTGTGHGVVVQVPTGPSKIISGQVGGTELFAVNNLGTVIGKGLAFSNSTNSSVFSAVNTSTVPTDTAVTFVASASNGLGKAFQGNQFSTTGNTVAIYGLNYSTTGTGILGLGNATSGANVGVWGLTKSSAGTGVLSQVPVGAKLFSGVTTAVGEVFSISSAGAVYGASFTGSGAGLTNLNATNLSTGIVPSTVVSGTYSNALTFSNAGNSFVGNGALLTNLDATKLTNGFTVAYPASGTLNILGGYSTNSITPLVQGAVIVGGGQASYANSVTDDFGVVGGGYGNRAGDNAGTTTDAFGAVVAGGTGNTASGSNSAVVGGSSNTASGYISSIGGGSGNSATDTAATIGGGFNNHAGFYGTVAGGGNSSANGQFSFTAGDQNEATGDKSVALGSYAISQAGSFVFSDPTFIGFLTPKYSGPGANTFGAYASNGFEFATHANSGVVDKRVSIDSTGLVTASGGFKGDGSQLTNLNGSQISTLDATKLTNGISLVNSGTGDPSIQIGNSVVTSKGSFAAGGDVGSISSNYVYDDFSVVAGGSQNQAGSNDANTFSSPWATVSGGNANVASATGAVVAGGAHNSSNGSEAFVGAGFSNTASGSQSVVVGGWSNSATGQYSSVLGGESNSAVGHSAAVLGGYLNTATGDYSVALGSAASASASNSFVFGDGTISNFNGLGTVKTFNVLATGGVLLATHQTTGVVDKSVSIDNNANLYATGTITAAGLKSSGGVGIGTSSPGAGSLLDVVGGSIAVGSTNQAANAAIHITSSFGGFDRLFQESPSAASKPGLNIVASTDSSNSQQWWAWGVDGNVFKIQPGVGFTPSAGIRIDSSGNLSVAGAIFAGTKDFKIDHPLDPENKYLYHAAIESSEMMNVYNGNVVLDRRGQAWVQLPDWFEALNRDFRYQLTAIGAPGPNLHVAHEVAGNRFQIAGGKAGSKVSWQVTGIRQDAYAIAHPIQVEEAKPESERGSYMHPDAFGQSQEKGVEYTQRANK